MNTSAVAKMLGISSSTVQRWVKQLELQMERNELGHYVFTDEDIKLLKHVQEQLNKGAILQDVAVDRKRARKGAIKATVNDQVTEKLLAKMNDFEQRLNQKADEVVSYQLLQHRREIEELQAEIKRLNERIEILEEGKSGMKKNMHAENLLIFDQEKPKRKVKRRNFITSFFGF